MAEATEPTEASTAAALSSALQTYHNKTKEANFVTFPSFKAATGDNAQILTRLSQSALQETLREIRSSQATIEGDITTVEKWASDLSKAPSATAHTHAAGYVSGAARKRHEELQSNLRACGTTEDQIHDTDINTARFALNDKGRAFFMPLI
ncbi:hypothetical protein IAT40_006830 [Kwoniella sp. CBS 6097]